MGVRVKFYRGAWWVFVCHQGQRKAKKVGGKDAALRVKQQIEERIAQAQFRLPSREGESFQVYAARWLTAAEKSLKASTVRFYRDNLENHLYPALGSVRLGAMTRQTVRELLEGLRAKALGAATVTGILRTLSTILSEAVEDERLPANPALRLGRLRRRLRHPDAPKQERIDPYTREEVEQLLETARTKAPPWYPFLLCAVRTGLRLGELRALEWGDLDWRRRFLHVSRNFVEGRRTVPKSGIARDVDMSLQLRGALRLWRRQQRAAWLARGKPLPALVFPSDAGTPLDDSKIRKAIAAIVTRAEVRVRRRVVHVLRHTFGSLLLQQGEPIVYVKEQMGHTSIAVTVDVYGHWIPTGNRDAVDRLDDATGRNPSATDALSAGSENRRKSFGISGEPCRNRTYNPQIKSRQTGPEKPELLNDRRRRRGKA